MAGGTAGNPGHNMPPPRRVASVNSGCLRGSDMRNLTLPSFYLPSIIKCGFFLRGVWGGEQKEGLKKIVGLKSQ
jgi:hypothetical protein